MRSLFMSNYEETISWTDPSIFYYSLNKWTIKSIMDFLLSTFCFEELFPEPNKINFFIISSRNNDIAKQNKVQLMIDVTES